MLNLKNKFKGQFRGDVSCPQYDLGTGDQNHVFTSCVKLKTCTNNMKFMDFKMFLKT